MKLPRRAVLALALPAALTVALAACQAGDAPWLTTPSAEEHARLFFPATPGSIHGECVCNDCHGESGGFGAGFDCLNCHAGAHANQAEVTAQHAGVASFTWDSAACLMCHKDGSGAGVDHAPIFPIATGAHAGTACAECHVDASNREVLGCAGCHPHEQSASAAEHTRVPDYAFDSARCVRCHADSQVDPVAGHRPFVIGTGTHSGSGRGDCLRCHPALRADKPFGADFRVADCLGCHGRSETDGEHRGRAEYAYATAACLRCHPTGRED